MDDLFGEDAWGEEPDWARDANSKETSGGGADEDDDNEDVPVILGAQHVILLVDCHADMFQPLTVNTDGAGDRPVDLALALAQQLLQQRIRDTVTLKIGKRDGVGLLLYDTKPLSTGSPLPPGEMSNGAEEHGDEAMKEDDEEDSEDEDDDDDDMTPRRQVHVLLDLNPPGIGEVQTLRACRKGVRNMEEEFANTQTSSNESSPRKAPLQTALEEAIRIFRKAKCVREKATKPNDPVDTRSIWILTNRDQPYPPSSTQHLLLQNVARDVQESGIQIMVWPLPRPGVPATDSKFSMESLYDTIVSRDVFEGRRLSTEEELEEGLEDLQQYWKKIRRLYWGPMLLPGTEKTHQGSSNDNEADDGQEEVEAPQIMVDWFRFVQLAKKPTKVQIDQTTKRETIKLKQYLDNMHEIFATFKSGDAEDRKIPKGGMKRIRQFATLGGENVPMSIDDLDKIRFAANGGRTKPALTILGFKPQNSIPWYHNMHTAYMIYPNDDVVKGSRDAFIELHAAMLRKQVLAIGEVLHRANWSSRLVAIYPLNENADSDKGAGEQWTPPGMMVVTLPFEDDIRTLEGDEAWQAWVREQTSSATVKQEVPDEIPSVDLKGSAATPMPSDELVQSAINLMSRQRLEGMELGEDFENAALTEFFNYLEAVALEIPVSHEKADYDTRPDDAMILEAVKDQIEEFRCRLPEDVEISKGSRGVSKRKKELPPDDSGLDWEDLFHSNELDQVKVPQLKSYLRSVGAPLSGNKGVLVERVADYIKEALAKSSKDGIKTEMD